MVKFLLNTATIGLITHKWVGTKGGRPDLVVQGQQAHPQQTEDQEDGCGFLHVLALPLILLYFDRAVVEMVHSVRYLGVHLANILTWRTNTTAVIKKAHQCLYLLRNLKKAQLDAIVFQTEKKLLPKCSQNAG